VVRFKTYIHFTPGIHVLGVTQNLCARDEDEKIASILRGKKTAVA
jgi:hypothetical protein